MEFKARVFQHEMDHIMGINRFSYTSSKGDLILTEEAKDHLYYEQLMKMKDICVMQNPYEESSIQKSRRMQKYQSKLQNDLFKEKGLLDKPTKYKYKEQNRR